MADDPQRNFRSAYYEKVGFRGVEEKKSLEILLKDNPLGRWRLIVTKHTLIIQPQQIEPGFITLDLSRFNFSVIAQNTDVLKCSLTSKLKCRVCACTEGDT